MRKLVLRKEVLTQLTADDLALVVAGADTVKSQGFCPTDPCITPPVSQLRCTYSLGEEFCG